jgi:signal transduction histidine kinase
MRLAEFITRDIEHILREWEAFAATRLPAAGHMKALELRNHAKQILEAIVVDLSTPQTRQEQTAKGLGFDAAPFDAPNTAAETHAVLRAKSGFDINQLASEYRALRASVLRLWSDACASGEQPQLEDVMRFNEAIDQALAESITFFSAEVEQSRNLLIGMLAHDMRNPLQTIQMTATVLAKLNAGEAISRAATHLRNSGAQMQSLLDDLLDFNRTELGLGIVMRPSQVNLAELCAEEVELIRAAHPGRDVQFQASGECRGWWDGSRVQQLLGNLAVNAVKYGSAVTPVCVAVVGRADGVHIEVQNQGPAIERATLASMFQPLRQGANVQEPRHGSLGLGLYIANQIVKSHGGTIDVRSDDTETVFAVDLPRRVEGAVAKPS